MVKVLYKNANIVFLKYLMISKEDSDESMYEKETLVQTLN